METHWVTGTVNNWWIHGVVIWKYLLPEYTKAFQEE